MSADLGNGLHVHIGGKLLRLQSASGLGNSSARTGRNSPSVKAHRDPVANEAPSKDHKTEVIRGKGFRKEVFFHRTEMRLKCDWAVFTTEH